MFSRFLYDITRPCYLSIFGELKRSGGMDVGELAKGMDMSYMGVKQHCENMLKMGYLEVRRVPRNAKAGRPRKLYKLTDKCDELFPSGGDELLFGLLQAVKLSFGESAPEKLLYHYFEEKREGWLKVIKSESSLIDKVNSFVKARTQLGHFCSCEHSPENGIVIEEYHHPLYRLFSLYPSLIQVENRMIEQTLGAKVVREEAKGEHGVKCTLYRINTL